jgi:hypothetical protein
MGDVQTYYTEGCSVAELLHEAWPCHYGDLLGNQILFINSRPVRRAIVFYYRLIFFGISCMLVSQWDLYITGPDKAE